ncbi:MAG: hypothetical protein NC420_14795 [Eubacterium sp.]|nr:hypothetical protein [Eubacterium sp.]
MKCIHKSFRKYLSLALMSALLLFSSMQAQAEGDALFSQYQSGEGASHPASESGYTVIVISTEEELAELAENCELDSWSRDKYVQLENDISLTEHTDLSIPSFGGIFDGGGHKITNLAIARAGSAQGLFRYVQEAGIVRNLEVSGRVLPEGTRSQVGILAGVNYGRITDCTVHGSVTGSRDVGGIAGINEATGEIRACQSTALVVGDHSAGGICGSNNGTLNHCQNSGGINIYSTDVEYDLEDLTMENLRDLNSAANMEAHTDTGGIAGYSQGKIYYCSNSGIVGYSHIGYNTGGIVGRLHQGYLQSCTNIGHVMGRKDVGGIVGQMEPFLEVQYLNDKLGEIDRETDRLFDLLDAAQEDISSYGRQASDLAGSVSANLTNVSSAASVLTTTTNDIWYLYNQELAGLGSDLQRLNADLAEQAGNEDIEITVPDTTVSSGNISSGNLNIQLPDNTESYRAALRRFGDSAGSHISNMTTATGDSRDTVTNNLNIFNAQLEAAGDHLQQLATVLQQGTDHISADVEAVIDQSKILRRSIQELRDDLFRYEGITVSDDSDEAAGEELGGSETAYYDTSAFQQGKITLCTNRGLVEADNSVGGIVGQVATEYDFDPEEDVSVSGAESFHIEQTIKAVIRESRNFGDVAGKKDYVGGIVGRADFGEVISCESYGAVSSASGSYVGGIAGSSSYCVRSCYAMGQLSGKNDVGGIAGKGCDIFYSYAYPQIELTGERGGSIAGQLQEDGYLAGNYYVRGNLPGIDAIGYEGGAAPLTYEEFCASEGVPAAFSEFTISFQADGKELASFQRRYGDSIDREEIPEVPEKEGCYGFWPEFDYTYITGNRVLEAQYENWVASLASEERDEEGKVRVLVQGEFLPEMRLVLSETPEGTWIAVRGTGETVDFAGSVTVRAVCADPGDTLVELYENGGYRQIPAEVMGSYVEFSMECPGAFRLTQKADNSGRLWLGGAAAAAVVLAAALIVKGVRKRRKQT